MMEPTTFVAAIAKVTTMADGSLRFILDTGENSIMAAAELMEIKKAGYAVRVTMEPIERKNDGSGG